MIYSVAINPLRTASNLNHDLTTVSKWAHQWKMAFNPKANKQAVELLFSYTFKTQPLSYFFKNGIQVNKATEHKHLGLIIDPKFIFPPHINEKIRKAQKSLRIIKFLSSCLPLKTLDQIYKVFYSFSI